MQILLSLDEELDDIRNEYEDNQEYDDQSYSDQYEDDYENFQDEENYIYVACSNALYCMR